MSLGIVLQGERAKVVLDLKGGFGNVDGDVMDGIRIFFHGFSRSCRGELAVIKSGGSVTRHPDPIRNPEYNTNKQNNKGR